MSYAQLSPAAQKRCDDAWQDPEVEYSAMVSRFTLTSQDCMDLHRRFGKKASINCLSQRSLNAKVRRERAAAAT